MLGLLESQSRVPRQSLNSQRVLVELGLLGPEQMATGPPLQQRKATKRHPRTRIEKKTLRKDQMYHELSSKREFFENTKCSTNSYHKNSNKNEMSHEFGSTSQTFRKKTKHESHQPHAAAPAIERHFVGQVMMSAGGQRRLLAVIGFCCVVLPCERLRPDWSFHFFFVRFVS